MIIVSSRSFSNTIVLMKIPSFSTLLPPARKRDTSGVLDRERQVEMKTVWVGRICRTCPHNKPAPTISKLREHDPWTDVFHTYTHTHTQYVYQPTL